LAHGAYSNLQLKLTAPPDLENEDYLKYVEYSRVELGIGLRAVDIDDKYTS